MSLKSEIAELADWLAGQDEPKDAGEDPKALPRQDWEEVRKSLKQVTKTFTTLAGRYPPDDILGDLANDLRCEAENLADRAYSLGRRAHDKVTKDAAELTLDVERLTRKNAELKATVDRLEKRLEAAGAKGSPAAPPTPDQSSEESDDTQTDGQTDDREPKELITSALRSLATTRDKLLRVLPSDTVTLAFLEELDVLAEMALSWSQTMRRPVSG